MKCREKEERKVISFPKYLTHHEAIVRLVANYTHTPIRTVCTAK